MAYTATDAIRTLNGYLGIRDEDRNIIENTKNRGFELPISPDENIVIFASPLVRKADGSKTYFDTRDSGAPEREITWNYALEHNEKYFCLGVRDDNEKYKDFVFSLECDEKTVEILSGTLFGKRSSKEGDAGNQIIIPNDFVPDIEHPYERIRTKMNVLISAVHKDSLYDYFSFYDNRPYLPQYSEFILETAKRSTEELGPVFVTGIQKEEQRNRIFFGAPGTGKSYQLNEEKDKLLEDKNDYERVTFHPDYSYANFVGTYKPVPDEARPDAITYKYVPGPFMRVLAEALKNGRDKENAKPYLLIVEEINRADPAAVFGDVFQLLDRGSNNASEYPIQLTKDAREYLADELGCHPDYCSTIQIPDNMFIWATMNSADQGVFPMDTAFKRRWNFTYIGIDKKQDALGHQKFTLGKGEYETKAEWNALRTAINSYLVTEHVNEDKQLGPFFLSKDIVAPDDRKEIDNQKFIDAFKDKVIMYLFEDAARQISPRLFSGCGEKNGRYSDICSAFDEKGIYVFCEEIYSAVNDYMKGTAKEE